MTRRVAVVTGVSRRAGIGFAVARRLTADGFDLVVQSWAPHDAEMRWGVDAHGPEALVEEVRSLGGRVEHLVADFEQPESAGSVISAAVAAFGHVDVLVQNGHYDGDYQIVTESDPQRWRDIMEVNLFGAFHLAQFVVPSMQARGGRGAGGALVILTSISHRGGGPAGPNVPSAAARGHNVTFDPGVGAPPDP